MISSARARSASRELFATFVVCTLVSALSLGRPVQARSQPPTHNPVDVHKHFQSAIDAIAAKWHVAIVAESAPIMEKAGADLSPSLPQETVEQAVARIAAAFDYSAKRKANVFVLNKLFTDPNDLPDVTLGEAASALNDINSLAGTFASKYPVAPAGGSSPAEAIAMVLSPQQLSSLHQGGVSVSSLDLIQRAEVWKMAMWCYTNEVWQGAEIAYDHLKALTSFEPVFRWESIGGQVEFGAEELTDAKADAEFEPISHPDTIAGFAKGPDGTRYPMRILSGPPDEQPPDPSDPITTSGDALETDVRFAKSHTIAGILARINSRGTDRRRHTVDLDLADKCIMDGGLGNASSDQIAFGVADAYGLELRHRNDGTANISRVHMAAVSGVTDLPRALKSAVPEAVSRCILARLGELRARLNAGYPNKSHWQNQFIDMGEAIKIIAVRNVRTAAQPMVLKASDEKVALSKLPLSSAKEFALAESVLAFSSVLHLADGKVPLYVSDFDQIVLTGEYVPKTSVTIHLSMRDPETGVPKEGPSVSYGDQ